VVTRSRSLDALVSGPSTSGLEIATEVVSDYGLSLEDMLHIEDEIREEFVVRAPALSQIRPAEQSDWDWYFLMQHFGAPTRLLDWSGRRSHRLIFCRQRQSRILRRSGLGSLTRINSMSGSSANKNSFVQRLAMNSGRQKIAQTLVATSRFEKEKIATCSSSNSPRAISPKNQFTTILLHASRKRPEWTRQT